MKKPFRTSLLVSICLASGTLAQVAPVATPVSEKGGVLRLAISRPQVAVGEPITISGFPLPSGDSVALQMTAQEAFAPNARIVVVRAGEETLLPVPDMTLLSGAVVGEDGSRAFLAFTSNGTQGFIEHAGRTYVISSGAPGSSLPTVVYDMANMPAGAISTGACAVEGAIGRIPGRSLPKATGEASNTRGQPPCRRADIAIETDYELLAGTFAGNADNATAYVGALFVAVSDIYQNELNTRFRVSYLRLWADQNDPWTQGSTVNQLFEWQDYWNANMTSVVRSAAHFLSGRALGGGVAYVGALCYPEYDYGLSANLNGFFPYPVQDHQSQNWDLMVVAHENGHIFGTGHTHDINSYNPIIDGCGLGDCSDAYNGTIMSYCHTCSGGMTNMSMHFGPRVTQRILEFLVSEATCDIRADAVIDIGPSPQSAYVGGSVAFSVAVSGAGSYTYQWRKNQTPIPDTNSAFLPLSNIQPSDAGDYDVVVTTECSSVTSSPAALTVWCPADFDHNGFVNGVDFDLFVGAFTEGDMAADFDGNGFLNGVDFDLFVYAFEAPC